MVVLSSECANDRLNCWNALMGNIEDINVVVIYDFARNVGGVNPVALMPAKVMAAKGANVFYCSAENFEELGSIKYRSLSSVARVDGEMYIRVLASIANFGAAWRVYRLLKSLDNKSTVVHFHGWGMALSSLVVLVTKCLKFKSVYTIHDYGIICPTGNYYNNKTNKNCSLPPMSMRCIISNCDKYSFVYKPLRIIRKFVDNYVGRVAYSIDKFIAVSELVKNVVTLNGVPKEKIVVHRNPIGETSVIQFDKVQYEYEVSFFGRVEKEKGVEMLCEACFQLNVKLDVFGDGSELERLKEKYKDASIIFHGWVSPLQVKNAIKKSKCVVVPSEWREPSGLVIDEALALGTPVLVPTNTGGMDKVPPSFLFEMANIESLKGCLTRVMSDLDEARAVARSKSQEIINYENYAQKLMGLYRELLDSKAKA